MGVLTAKVIQKKLFLPLCDYRSIARAVVIHINITCTSEQHNENNSLLSSGSSVSLEMANKLDLNSLAAEVKKLLNGGSRIELTKSAMALFMGAVLT
jgi:hypothetical protein